MIPDFLRYKDERYVLGRTVESLYDKDAKKFTISKYAKNEYSYDYHMVGRCEYFKNISEMALRLPLLGITEYYTVRRMKFVPVHFTATNEGYFTKHELT